jgi:hypothetical protein
MTLEINDNGINLCNASDVYVLNREGSVCMSALRTATPGWITKQCISQYQYHFLKIFQQLSTMSNSNLIN